MPRCAQCHRANGEFLVFEQSHLIAADVVRSKVIASFLCIAAKLLDRYEVGANGRLCAVAANEFLSHPLGEYGHPTSPFSVTNTIASAALPMHGEAVRRPQRLRSGRRGMSNRFPPQVDCGETRLLK